MAGACPTNDWVQVMIDERTGVFGETVAVPTDGTPLPDGWPRQTIALCTENLYCVHFEKLDASQRLHSNRIT